MPQYTHLDLLVQRPVDKGHAVQRVRLESGPRDCRRMIPGPVSYIRLPRAHQQALRLLLIEKVKSVSVYTFFQGWVARGRFLMVYFKR